ncbi:MAG: heme exporter protein CcmB [Acidobacteriota bacterium]
MTFLWAVFIIMGKDLRSELRTGQNLASVLFFALVILVIFHFAFDLVNLSFATVAPGLLWVAITFASMLGLQNSFAREGEQNGLAGLLLSTMDPAAIYAGKALAMLCTLLVAEVIFLPAAALLFNADLRPVALPLFTVVAIHTAGLSFVGTLFAAMALRVRRGYLLLPVLQFTVTVPLLMSAVKATAGVLMEGSLSAAGVWLRLGIAYDMVFFTVSAMLFEPLIQD